MSSQKAASSQTHIPHFSTADEVVEYVRRFVKDKQWAYIADVLRAHIDLVGNNPHAQQFMGMDAFEKEDYLTASTYFMNALRLDESFAYAAFLLGQCQRNLGDLHSAMKFLNHSIKLKPDSYPAMATLASVLREMNRPELALKWYKKIEQECPDYPLLDNQFGIVYDGLGEEEIADEYYGKALNLEPDNTAIIYNMVYRKKYALDSDMTKHLLTLRDRMKEENRLENLTYAYYSLAIIYEKNKEHKKAFEYYKEANEIQSRLVPSLIEEETFWGNSIINAYPKEFVERFSPEDGCPDDTPIFVVGMPRSGTSLTEQIISSHHDGAGAGELELARRIVLKDIASITGEVYPSGLQKLQPQHLKMLGEHYVKCAKTYSSTKHIVDKMPHNFYHVAILRMTLPNAKIIHCVRDPMDTCWSIWRQAFYGRHTYKYDFDHMGRAYAQYLKLMRYWHELFPGQIYDLSYEKLLDNPETEVRALLDYCNLEWDENCLNFHKSKRNVFTASTFQVRQPLYKSALKSWEPVKEELQPLKEALTKYGAYES